MENIEESEKCNLENKDFHLEEGHVDSKTLKYQFQTAQNELKKHIERLEIANDSQQTKVRELENMLVIEKQEMVKKEKQNMLLKEEMSILEQRLKEASNEAQQLRDKLSALQTETKSITDNAASWGNSNVTNGVNLEQFTALEEELVFIKEKYAKLSEEKLLMNKELNSVREQYNAVCNRSYNNMFFYVVPLVLMVLYLLISNMFSWFTAILLIFFYYFFEFLLKIIKET